MRKRNPLDDENSGRSVNLQALRRGEYKEGGWPDEEDRWRHSDIREVAYPYNFRAFDDMVLRGGLAK